MSSSEPVTRSSCALEVLGTLTGTVVVTYGDVPLLRPETLAALATEHAGNGNAVTVLTARVADPTGYGRIIRDDAGAVAGIVEHKDADEAQRAITEINSGVYAFDAAVLADGLGRITAANAQGERYLTDVVGIARADGRRVGALVADDATETEGVNDRVQLADMARALNARLIRAAQLGGATILDPQTTWLHADVTVAADAIIHRNTSLESGTTVETGAEIGPDTTLIGCRVGAGATVLRSHAQGAVIGEGSTIGPFSYLRPGTVTEQGAKVGAYVEVKNVHHRRRRQSAAPELRGRRHARRRGELRRRLDHRQLRRCGQVPDRRRTGRVHRHPHHPDRPGDRRRRRLHRRRVGDHRRRGRRRPRRGPRPTGHRHGLGRSTAAHQCDGPGGGQCGRRRSRAHRR